MRAARILVTALLAFATVVGAQSAGTLETSEASQVSTSWGSDLRLEPRRVIVDGLRTAYATVGPETGIPLLLLNGTGSPMAQWDPALLDGLSRRQRVVVYDYPGLGGSEPLRGRLTFARLADHAAALLGALGYRQADVLGWSMGGFVAQRLAVRAPERVHALVLAATNPGGPRAVLGPSWVQEEDSDPAASAAAYVRTNYPAGTRHRGWAFIRRVDEAIASGRYPPDTVPARTYAAMVAAEDPWLTSPANLAELSRLTVPVLVATGADDVVTPPANSRLLAAAVPRARLALVARAGHSFLFQQPYRVAELVSGFLAARG